MQYQCVQCDHVFELPAGEAKPRCPLCLRQHGLRVVEAVSPRRQLSQRWLFVAVACGVLAVAGAGYAGYRQFYAASDQLALSAAGLRAEVERRTGKDPGVFAQLLAADDRVAAFAKRAAKGVAVQSAPTEAATSLVRALTERRQKQAFVHWSRAEARMEPPLAAADVLAAIEQDGARKRLYPLELSVLAVAALRSLGVAALVAEVYRVPGETAPLDPSGRIGYHALLLPKRAAQPEQVFDVYAGRTAEIPAGDYKVLSDVQVLGAAYALRALSQLDQGGDTAMGLADAELAIKLSPSSASVRSVRAALLLATGGAEAGTHELDAALSLRRDAPRHNNVAAIALASGDLEAAAKEVTVALGQTPDFALARVTLATVHLMRGENQLAQVELQKAERLDPDLSVLPQAWAQYYVATHELDRALVKAQEAVTRRPKDVQARIVLARVDHAAGHYEDMREQAEQAVALVPGPQQSRLREVLKSVLGPTAFEDPAAASRVDDAEEAKEKR